MTSPKPSRNTRKAASDHVSRGMAWGEARLRALVMSTLLAALLA